MQVNTVEDGSCTAPRAKHGNIAALSESRGQLKGQSRRVFFPPLMGRTRISFVACEDYHPNDNKDGRKDGKMAKSSKQQYHLKFVRKLTLWSQLMENTTFTVCVCAWVGG